MKQANRMMIFLLTILLLAGLACNMPDLGGRVPEDASERAADAAATAAAAAQGAGNTAATVAAVASAQGGSALATAQAFDRSGLEAELANLREQFESVELGEDGQVTLTITEEEINQLLRLRETLSVIPSRLQNVAIQFEAETVVLTANVAEPVNGLLTVSFRPHVEEGTLQFELVTATLGNFQVPAALLQSAESTVNSTLGQVVNQLPSNLQVVSVAVADGAMTVVAGRR